MRWYRALLPGLLFVIAHTSCAKEDTGGLYEKKKPAGSSASCVDHCGGGSEDESCWCDPTCGTVGDCCSDFDSACGNTIPGSGGFPGSGGSGGKPSFGGSGGTGTGGTGTGGTGTGGSSFGGSGGGVGANSCKNHCGGQSLDGSCFCNPDCQQFGDCCPDFTLVCPSQPPPGGCTPDLCLVDTPTAQGCYCDPFCFEFGDCCPNVDQVCG